jgi:hypothetical protein
MLEEIAQRTRSAYSDIRDVPALPIKVTLDRTPILTFPIIYHLVGQIEDVVPPSTVLDTLLKMGVEAEAKASLADLAFAEVGESTSNEHAMGAMASIGTMRTVTTEFVGQMTEAKAAHKRVVQALGELTSALVAYRVAAHDAYRPAEMMIETRHIATQELKNYYAQIMGPNGEIREEWNL